MASDNLFDGYENFKGDERKDRHPNKSCPVCGEMYYDFGGTKKVCSLACSVVPGFHKGRVARIKRACAICGKEIEILESVLKHGKGNTCSKKCRYELASRSNTGKRMVERFILKCAYCGKEIKRTAAYMKIHAAKKYFCNADCQRLGCPGKGRKLNITDKTKAAWLIRNRNAANTRVASGWKPSAKTRAKLSAAASRQLASGSFGKVSKLEKRVERFIRAFKIPYETQHVFTFGKKSFVADFWFPSLRAVIEVNGTFWHADPRVYAAPKHAMQISRCKSDQLKRSMYKSNGIHLIELWESDFKKTPSMAMRSVYGRLTRQQYEDANRMYGCAA